MEKLSYKCDVYDKCKYKDKLCTFCKTGIIIDVSNNSGKSEN